MRLRTLAPLAAVLLATIALPSALAQDATATPGKDQVAVKPKRPDIYDANAVAKEQIARALAKAKKDNARVLIQWGANWCGWCHILHEHFKSNRDVARKLLYEYEVVLIDIGRWDKNLDLAAKYEADFQSHGVPFLTVLDADGKVLANQATGPLETKEAGKNNENKVPPGHDGEKVLEFLTQHQAAYLPAESLLKDALTRARAEKKSVFLHFGAPWCGWCHRLEDWMAREEVATTLARDVVSVKIDTDRTIGGKEMMLGYTDGQQKGIPWFAFLTPEGKVIATSDNEEGQNLGCPWTDAEIDDFEVVLGTVCRRMSEADIKRVCSFLGKNAKQNER